MLLTRIVLLAFALLYGLLALWCGLAVDSTAAALGLVLSDGSARSEYITVYVGLEAGLALFFSLCAAGDGAARRCGLLLALCSSGALALARMGSLLVVVDPRPITWIMLAVEVALTLLAACSWLRLRNTGGHSPTT